MNGTLDESANTCTFDYPELSLAPDEQWIEARPLSTDMETCVVVYEIGTAAKEESPSEDRSPSDGSSSVEEARPAGNHDESLALLTPEKDEGSTLASASGSGSAYFRAYWHDAVHLKVTEAHANIDWSWDGSCVTSSSGNLLGAHFPLGNDQSLTVFHFILSTSTPIIRTPCFVLGSISTTSMTMSK